MGIQRVRIVGARGRRRSLRSERGLLLERLVDVRAESVEDFDGPHVTNIFLLCFYEGSVWVYTASYLLLLGL